MARGDKPPGLCPVAMSRHENGVKRPGPYYVAWYCEIYRATPEQLGLALPDENGHHDDVDRREFLTGTTGFLVTLALPTPTQLGQADLVRLRESVAHLYAVDHYQGGADGSYQMTLRLVERLRSLVEHASYDQATGRALRELIGLTAAQGGWLAYDIDQQDQAHHWWLQALKWAQLAESDSVGVLATASMALQASDYRQREAVDFAELAQRTAGRTTPRMTSLLLARTALAHAGQGDASSAHTALLRASEHTETRHDDDPLWLDFYGPASFAGHEHRAMLMLGDTSAAEEAARTALALSNPVAYPRARALYLTYLANVLVQRREMDEGSAVAKQATVAAAGLDSGRVTRQLHAVTQSLAA